MIPFQNQAVASYVDTLTEWQRSIVLDIREAVLQADARVKEAIKWGSICFFHHQNICGYRVAKKHVTFLFTEGASLDDPEGILAGSGAKARTYRVEAGEKVNKEALADLVQQALAKGM